VPVAVKEVWRRFSPDFAKPAQIRGDGRMDEWKIGKLEGAVPIIQSSNLPVFHPSSPDPKSDTVPEPWLIFPMW
jgi:hypothetical protein